jgi:hypothetical protein
MTFTPEQHKAMAQVWNRYNGMRGTEKQALRTMKVVSAADLYRMLLARNIDVQKAA